MTQTGAKAISLLVALHLWTCCSAQDAQVSRSLPDVKNPLSSRLRQNFSSDSEHCNKDFEVGIFSLSSALGQTFFHFTVPSLCPTETCLNFFIKEKFYYPFLIF